MKNKFLTLALASFMVAGCHATPVLFTLQSLTGNVNNRSILVQPDRTPLTPLNYGTNLVPLGDFVLQPVAGSVQTNLLPWGYTIKVDGWPRSAHIVVPNSSTVQLAALLLNTNQFSPLNIYYVGTATNVDNSTGTNVNLTGNFTGSILDAVGNIELDFTARLLNRISGGQPRTAVDFQNCQLATSPSHSPNVTLDWYNQYLFGTWGFDGLVGNGAGLTNVTAAAVNGWDTNIVILTGGVGIDTNMAATYYWSNSLNAYYKFTDQRFYLSYIGAGAWQVFSNAFSQSYNNTFGGNVFPYTWTASPTANAPTNGSYGPYKFTGKFIGDGAGVSNVPAALLVFGTTNQIIFGGTNTPPASTNLIRWISVQIAGDTNAWRLGLAK